MDSIAVSVARSRAFSVIWGAQPDPRPGDARAACGIGQREILREELSVYDSRLDRRLVPQLVSRPESGRTDPIAMIVPTFDARDLRAAFDFVETHPESMLEVTLAFDE